MKVTNEQAIGRDVARNFRQLASELATDVANLALLDTRVDAVENLGQKAYAQVTASQTGINTSGADLTGLSVTFTAVAGRRYRITGYARVRQQTGTGTVTMRIFDSSTQIQAWQAVLTASSSATAVPSIVVSPAAGSKTYKLNLITSASTVDMEASATALAYIMVEDVGAA